MHAISLGVFGNVEHADKIQQHCKRHLQNLIESKVINKVRMEIAEAFNASFNALIKIYVIFRNLAKNWRVLCKIKDGFLIITLTQSSKDSKGYI